LVVVTGGGVVPGVCGVVVGVTTGVVAAGGAAEVATGRVTAGGSGVVEGTRWVEVISGVRVAVVVTDEPLVEAVVVVDGSFGRWQAAIQTSSNSVAVRPRRIRFIATILSFVLES
jgi:hypothetical protein